MEGEGSALVEGLAKWGFVPTGDFHGVEMENGRQGVEFVQARNDTAVFDVRQTTDVQDEVRAAATHSDLVTGFLDITVGEAESFAGLT